MKKLKIQWTAAIVAVGTLTSFVAPTTYSVVSAKASTPTTSGIEVKKVTDDIGKEFVTETIDYPELKSPGLTRGLESGYFYRIKSETKANAVTSGADITVKKGSKLSFSRTETVAVDTKVEAGATADAQTLFAKVSLSGKVAVGKKRSETIKVKYDSGIEKQTTTYRIRWGKKVDTVKGEKYFVSPFGKVTVINNITLKVGYGTWMSNAG